MAESDKRNSVCGMTSSFWKQLYEVSWREEEKEGILGLSFIIKNHWYVISPFVTLHGEIKTDLLPQGISTNDRRNLELGSIAH